MEKINDFNTRATQNATHVNAHRNVRRTAEELNSESFDTKETLSLGGGQSDLKLLNLKNGKPFGNNVEEKCEDLVSSEEPKSNQPSSKGSSQLLTPFTMMPQNEGEHLFLDPNTGKPYDSLQGLLSGGNPHLTQLINSGAVSPEDLQKILDMDTKRRQDEESLLKQQTSNWKAQNDCMTNIMMEAKNAQTYRENFLVQLFADLAKSDAQIAANRTKRTRSIAQSMYETLCGS